MVKAGQHCEGLAAFNSVFVTATRSVVVDVYVIDFKPLGFEFILGINGISALGGVTIFPSLATHFGSAKTDEKPVCSGATKVEKPVCRVAMRLRLMSLIFVFRLTLQRKLGL